MPSRFAATNNIKPQQEKHENKQHPQVIYHNHNHHNNNNNKETKVNMRQKKKKTTTTTITKATTATKVTKNPVSRNIINFIKKDPLEKYEIVKVLGEGSIGAVSCVRMKPDAVGGSAYSPKNNKNNQGGCFAFLPFFRINNFNKNNNNNSFIDHDSDSEDSKEPVLDRKVKNVLYAMKSIQIRRINDEFLEELRNEISILQSMDHPNIVKAYEVYEWKGQIYVIMEHCAGGDLYEKKPYSEKEACKIIKNLCSAINYMHDSKHIIHRDLKFENIMFDSATLDASNGAEIKVIDFGLSTKFKPGEKLTDGVGTIYTMAPQVLQGVYTAKADMWSIGVIAYLLLSGQKPFYDRKRRRVIDKIMRCKYDFHAPIWDGISRQAKDFIVKLIEIDPRKRMSSSQALQHPWLNGNHFLLSNKKPPPSELMKDVENNIFSFAKSNELKKVALMVVAHRSSPEETRVLRRAFSQYDKDNNGTISKDEFILALKNYDRDLSDSEICEIFNSININNNGVILYTEFLAATLETAGNVEEERLANAFDQIDTDDTGYITKKNLSQLLGKAYSSSYINDIFDEVDLNKDGKISFTEFLHACRKRRSLESVEIQHDFSNHRSSGRDSPDSMELICNTVVPGGSHDLTATSNGSPGKSTSILSEKAQ